MRHLNKVGLLLIVGSIIFSVSKASIAQNTSCSNSWINPKTGLENCLDRQLSGHPSNNNTNNQNRKKQSSNISDLPGYIELAETRQGDKVYIEADTIRVYKKARWHTVDFQMMTKFGIPDQGSRKRVISYSADCDTNTLSMKSIYNYDGYNQIINGTTFGMTTASRFQSTMSPPQVMVSPNTVGYAAFEYVCSLDT